MDKKPGTIKEYMAGYPAEVRKVLEEIYRTIKEEAPQAQERMSWQMPTFYYCGNVVHFAAQKTHLGFYPGASGIEHFWKELEEYKTSKGAAQFPYNKPIPYDLVRRMVRFRLAENEEEHNKKKEEKNRLSIQVLN